MTHVHSVYKRASEALRLCGEGGWVFATETKRGQLEVGAAERSVRLVAAGKLRLPEVSAEIEQLTMVVSPCEPLRCREGERCKALLVRPTALAGPLCKWILPGERTMFSLFWQVGWRMRTQGGWPSDEEWTRAFLTQVQGRTSDKSVICNAARFVTNRRCCVLCLRTSQEALLALARHGQLTVEDTRLLQPYSCTNYPPRALHVLPRGRWCGFATPPVRVEGDKLRWTRSLRLTDIALYIPEGETVTVLNQHNLLRL